MDLKRQQFFKFVIFWFICVLPSLSVAFGNSCLSLFVPSEFDDGIFSNTPKVERPQILTPWVRSKTEVVKPKSVSPEELQLLERDILRLEQLSQLILRGEGILSSRQSQDADAFYTASISQFLAHHGVTHEVLEFRSLTGKKIFKIRMLTTREGAKPSPMSLLADRLDALQADLVFSVHMLLSFHFEAAVLPSVDTMRSQSSWATGAINELLLPIPKDRAMLMLPIYGILHPEYSPYSPAVNHEIHHIETMFKLKQGLPFSFYGSAFFGKRFSFLDLIYAHPPVIQAMNGGYRGLSLDEASAMTEFLLKIKTSLRHSNSEYYDPQSGENHLIQDLGFYGGMTKAINQVSKIVASEVIRWTFSKSEKIKFDVRENVIFAHIVLSIEKKGKVIEVELNIPLVAARASHSKTQKLETLRKQMEAMMKDADRNSVLGEWCEKFPELRLKEDYDGPAQHDLAIIFTQTLYQENDESVSVEQYRQNLQERFKIAVQQWRQAHPGWQSN